MHADLLLLLLENAAAATFAVLLVLTLRTRLRRTFGSRAVYALWLMVPIALVAVWLPAAVRDARMVLDFVSDATTAEFASAPLLVTVSDHSGAWLIVWSLGAVALALFFGMQQARFIRGLGTRTLREDGTELAQTMAGCPALVGALHPRIVLPQDFEARYTGEERALVLLHERSHLKSGDAQINAVVAALRCVFWFNPLVHWAAARFRFDQELACDARVIAQAPSARRAYAEAMLKTQLTFVGLPIGCHWQSTHPLTERIVMLKHPLPGRIRVFAGSLLVALLATGCGLAAWAMQPESHNLQVGSKGEANYDVAIRLTVDGKTSTPRIITREGIESMVSEGDGDERIGLRFRIFGRAATDQVEIRGQIITGASERVVGSPSLVVKLGTPAIIRVGAGADGSQAFELELTVKHAGSRVAPAVVAVPTASAGTG